MCLDSITEREKLLPEAMVAFKVVRGLNVRAGGLDDKNYVYFRRGYLPDVRDRDISEPKLLGQGWALKDGAREISTNNALKLLGTGFPCFYEPGVHAYPNAAHAYLEAGMRCDPFCAVVKVYLRGPIAAGHQNGCPVVVYREMTLIEEISRL